MDRVARKVVPGVPLSRVYSALRSGEIRLNGKRVKGDARVSAGDSLDAKEWLVSSVNRSPLPAPAEITSGAPSPSRDRTVPQRPLDGRIVFESPHIIVISKLRGEVVHGPDSLETLVRAHLLPSAAAGVSFAPGPVHRLDRNTTGLVVYSASLRGAQEMSKALRGHRVRKLYAAVLSGEVAAEERWDSRIRRDDVTRKSGVATQGSSDTQPGRSAGGGQEALTLVTPVAVADGASLVVARIVTGRTHQIRAHATANGTPLYGDRKYGGPAFPGGYILHAGALAITTPSKEIDFGHLWTPLPAVAEGRVERLFGKSALNQLYEVFSVGR